MMLRGRFQDLLAAGLAWRALIVAGAPLLVAGLVLFPAWTRLTQAEVALSQASLDLEWLASKAESVPPARPLPGQKPPRAVDLERILEAHGLRPALQGMTEQLDNRLLLSLGEVEFQRLVRFLHHLETDHAGALREVSIAPGAPGFTSATIVIRGSPG